MSGVLAYSRLSAAITPWMNRKTEHEINQKLQAPTEKHIALA